MSAPDHINEVAAVIDSTWTFEADDDEHPAREIAQALAEAGWLRTAEDRAVIEAAEEFETWYMASAKKWPNVGDGWSDFIAAERKLASAVRARRAAVGGSVPADPPIDWEANPQAWAEANGHVPGCYADKFCRCPADPEGTA